MSLRARSFGSSFILAATLVLFGAPVAQAHDAPNGFYIEGGGGLEYWSIPSVEAIVDPSGNAIGNTDGSFWAKTGFVAFGFVDGDGTRLPDPIGRDARIEGRVRWARGDSDKTVDTLNPLGFREITNPTLPANGSVGGVPNQAIYETDLTSWEAELLYKTDVPFNDMLILTPFAGIAYAHLDVRNDFQIISNGADLSGLFSLDDEIEAHFGGLVLGGDVTFRPVSVFSVRAGVRADLMCVDSKLEADQNFARGLFGTAPFVNNHESARDIDFAARVGASLGMALHLGMFEIGVDGNARYHSYMPTAQHPTSVTDRTSQVGGHAAWTGSVMGRISILIP